MISEIFIGSLQIHDTLSTVGIPTGDFAVTRFTGLGTASPRENRPTKSRRHGLYEQTTYYDGRAISLEGIVSGSGYDDLWDNWNAFKQGFALDGETMILKWRKKGLEWLERAFVSPASEIEWDLVGGRVEPRIRYAVDLIAADPRIYRDVLEDFTFASTANITNDGNFSTPPIITFNSPGADPGIRNNDLASQNEIKLEWPGGGGPIEVNVQERTVRAAGVLRNDIIKLEDTAFWSLRRGVNNVEKLGAATSITIEWRAAWN